MLAWLWYQASLRDVLSYTIQVHGGLHEKDGVKLSDIRNIDRDREPPEGGLMCDLLWSDPHDGLGRAPSKRGTGK